jgi:hypothetical protein
LPIKVSIRADYRAITGDTPEFPGLPMMGKTYIKYIIEMEDKNGRKRETL